jgi:hypothetical protein
VIQCPVCQLQLRDDDLFAQSEHMKQNHLEVIAERLRQDGFRQEPDGTWIDLLATEG